MRRPEVSSRWDAAVTIDNLHTTDLYVDNDVPADGDEELPEDKPAAHFGEFYEHYRKAFLSMETHPWYDAHAVRWGEKTGITAQRRSETSIVDFYDRSFSSKLKTEVAHPDWPKSAEYNTFMAAVMANQLVANCDEHLRAALYSHTTHRNLVKPENMHQWNLVAIYDALREIERDPAFVAQTAERRNQQANQGNASHIKALETRINALQSQGGGDNGRGRKDNNAHTAGREHMVYKCNSWKRLSQASQAAVRDKQAVIATLTPVPGADGQITYSHFDKSAKRWAPCSSAADGAKIDTCYLWVEDNGLEVNQHHCCQPGHKHTNCPNKLPKTQVNANKSMTKNQKKKANKSAKAAGLEQAQFQVNMIKALQAVAERADPGGDSSALTQILAQQQAALAQINPICTVHSLNAATRTHALTLPASGSPFTDTEVLIDTGSVYNIGTMNAWRRLRKLGLAGPLVEKDDMVTFVSASGDDLGYTHWSILDAQVGSDRRPMVLKIATKMEETFPLIMGMDGLAALQGTIDFIASHVQLRDCQGCPHSFAFEPVTPQKPLMTPAQNHVRPVGASKVRKPSKWSNAPSRKVTAWSTALCALLTASVAGLLTPSEPPLTQGFANGSTVAVNQIFNQSFDDGVELHCPLLDPDMPSPFSDWDPDATRSLELATPVLAVTDASLYNESIPALPQPPPLNDSGTAWQRLRRPAMALASSHNSCGDSTTATASVGDTDLASHVRPGDRVDVVPTLPVGVGNSNLNLSSESSPADAEPVDDATTDRGANAWHSPVLDPVDPWLQPNSSSAPTFEHAATAAFDSLNGSYHTDLHQDEQGFDSYTAKFDLHGIHIATDICSCDYATGQTTQATLRNHVGLVKVGIMVDDVFLDGYQDTSGHSCTKSSIRAVYRKVEGDTLWQQLGLENNPWANLPRNKGILSKALAASGEIFTPDKDGNLRRVNNPDGSPVEVDINLKPGANVRHRAYRSGKFAKEQVRAKLLELEAQGLITRADDSTWGSSLLVVPKPGSGDIRMTVDYRQLNKRIEMYSYPCATAQDLFSRMAGATRFTTLDFKTWFYQFALSERSKECTTFVTPDNGAWKWNVLPMGVCISPQIVQAFVDKIFRCKYDGPGKRHGCNASELVSAFCDDVCVYTDDEDHADVLAWVLNRLRQCNVQVAPKKAFVGQPRICFLGHYLDKDGLHVDPAKVEAINAMAPPTDATGIKRFLGAAGYYRQFVENFGTRTVQMTNLLKKENAFEWTPAHDLEFQDIKAALVKAPILALPRWDLPFIVRTDASEHGIGVLLVQEIDGVRRIVSCASRKWTPCEYNWDVRRKECFGNVYAVRKFREYLQGNHFVLETDHRNLLWLSKVESHTQQLYRWALELSTLDYTVKHVAGSSLHDADMLSRAPLPAEDNGVDEDEEWQNYQFNAVANTSAQQQYNVLALGFGIGCDVMATANTPFKVVGGCEVDPVAIKHFEERTGAPCYGSIQDLDRQLDEGLKLDKIDVVSLTVSCSSRSRLNRINKKPVEHNDGHMFTQSMSTIGKINPRMCYVEMVCSNPAHNDPQDFHEVEKALGDLFPHVQSRVMQMSKHGAYTDRCRYVCWASQCDTPMQWPEESKTFPGLHGILLSPPDVPLTYRADHYTPSQRDLDRGPFNSKRLGTVTKGDGNRASDTMHNRLYSPDHPCPTFTSAYTFCGNKGSQWYLDAMGPRQLTLNEECDVHNFDCTSKAFLATLPKGTALGYVARSIPVAPLASLYECFLHCLQGDDEAAFKPLQCDHEALDPHQTAVLSLKIWQAMPSLDEFRAAQHSDPDIAPLFKYHSGDRKAVIPPKYQRELPHTVVQDGVIYYRTLLGDDESLVQAVLLPAALVPKVMCALHDSPIYCHPGVKATLTIVRQKVYWKHMVKDIKEYIRLCEVCLLKRNEILKHAGKQVSEFYYMPFQRIGIDLVGELPRCDGDCYILHIVCWASGFNYIACIPDKKASTVAAELHKYFLLFGQPTDAIVTDNGREFVNAAFDELTAKWGCRTIRTSPYHPKGNSRTERRHRDSNTILRTAVNRYGETWKVGAYLANWALNVRPRTGSTHSPYELLLGFKPSVPGEKSVEELDGLKLHRATLSDPELLKNLDLHRCWALDNNAALQKECAQNSKLRADQARYSITYSPGDLVNVTRPRIGKRSKGTATRLMYQQVGPFEVVRHLGNNAYRLRKLGTDHVSTHNVQHLHPYLTKEAYEKKIVGPALEEAAKAPHPPLKTAYVPKPGDHLLYTGFATKDKPFFLVKVESYDDRTGEVTFQFYNNGTSNGNLTGHRLCWTTPPGEDGDEIQSMRRPANVCYEPFRETDTLDKFCLHPMPVKRLSASVRLAQKDVTHAMRLKRLPTLAIAMTSLGGRGARRHPGMAAIAMVATMAQAVSASAVNSVSRSWAPAEYSWDTRRLEAEHALSSLRLQHVNEQQHSSSPTYILILSAIVCVTLLAIAMVWNSDNDNDGYDGSDDYDDSDEDDEATTTTTTTTATITTAATITTPGEPTKLNVRKCWPRSGTTTPTTSTT